jgi:hypothetical protein
MKTLVLGTIASLTLSVALVAAQQQTPPPTQQTPPPTQQQQTPPPDPPRVPTQPPTTPPAQAAAQKLADVELTGCLVQGTGPTVFIIENAKTETQTEAEKGKTYVLVSGAEKLEFTPHLNKKVKISGSLDQTSMAKVTPPPAGQKIEEKDLPRLTVRTVTHVADTCALMF